MANRISFGRIVRLEFSNFTTKKKYYIDQSLRINFSFLKAWDESIESSKGQITIYGLTEETANKLATNIQAGGYFTTEVKCDVGYSNDSENIKTLFYAIVSDISFKKTGGTSETVISVNANMRDLNLSGFFSISLGSTSIQKVMDTMYEVWGYNTTIDFANVSEDISTQTSVAQFFANMSILNWSSTGSLDDYINQISKTFNFGYTIDSGEKMVTFFVKDNSIESVIEMARVKVASTIESSSSLNIQKDRESKQQKITTLYKTQPEEQNTKVVLTPTTGLLKFPYLANKNVTVASNQALQDNETLNKIRDAKVKVKKNGEVKVTQPKTKKISRRYLTAVALINPNIKPNKQIQVKDMSEKIDGEYRCRTCKFSGDTHEGDFIVEMELVDTNDFSPPIPEKSSETDLQSITYTNDEVNIDE